ncbi:MAG TPA: GMC family oxidoreductase [Gemmatimonadales bacterium]|nr:GMC family oxidoreductase [Gemmatimonadales bacterium]
MIRYRPQTEVDFVIVGSGGAGGILAKELSVAGHSVVVLEQGPWLEQEHTRHDEFSTQILYSTWNDFFRHPQTFQKTANDAPIRSSEFVGLYYGRHVGGSNSHFTANYWRMHENDFRERSLYGEHAALADWPISYADLEPYYTKAEWELGVSGAPGPFDPPRSKAYPLPPLPPKAGGIVFARGARKLGLHPQRAPMAILSRPYDGRQPCKHCGFCLGYQCEYKAKSSAFSAMIPKAVASGKCEIRPDSYVFRVEMNASGRATGVRYYDKARQEQVQRGRAVILCCNGAETPRLLLMSESSQFRDGLANSSGLVGKHLMFNCAAGATAVFPEPLNEWKSVGCTHLVMDFHEGDPARGFYGGGGMDARLDWTGPISFALFHTRPDAPNWGADFKRQLVESFSHRVSIFCHGTSLAVETNQVLLDPELKDAWGLPAIRFRYRDHPDDLANVGFLQGHAHDILQAAGATQVWNDPIVEQTWANHMLGTCRMGNDPRTSVIDANHRTHDVRNLFICDGSSMVTSSRGQPTATIQALAFRAADTIPQALKA